MYSIRIIQLLQTFNTYYRRGKKILGKRSIAQNRLCNKYIYILSSIKKVYCQALAKVEWYFMAYLEKMLRNFDCLRFTTIKFKHMSACYHIWQKVNKTRT